jgi:tRNA modification GTPase
LSGQGLAVVRDVLLQPRRATPWRDRRVRRVDVRDAAGVFDDGLACWISGPATVTGEDVLEVSVHGNPLIVERALAAAIAAGARLAEPGEFTRRAVRHGKIDLIQAEAVDQVVRATSPDGLRLAREGANGSLSTAFAALRSTLLDACAELEARLDHPDDALADMDDPTLIDGLIGCAERSEALAAGHAAGRRLVDGASVAIVGGVNAGKSSLFNALIGERRALVHETPGTTRDVVEAHVRLGPLAVTLLDTAGERPTDDPVEAAGLALAAERIASVDLVLVVLRAGLPDPAAQLVLERTADRPRVIAWNGTDRATAGAAPDGCLPTSAITGQGLDALRAALIRALLDVPVESALIASLRQADAARWIASACREAVSALPDAGPAVASEILLEAIGELDALTGADTREDVLDALFARFCIGK